MACSQQKRFHVLARRRLLEPADHRTLTSMFRRVENRKRFAARPVAQEQRCAEQVLPVPPTMHVHRPCHRRLDLRPLMHQLVIVGSAFWIREARSRKPGATKV